MPNEKKSKGIIIVKNGRNPKAQKANKVDSVSVEEPVADDVLTEEKLIKDIEHKDNLICGDNNQKEENVSQNIDNVYQNSEQNDKSIENPAPADGFIDSENDNASDDISGQAAEEAADNNTALNVVDDRESDGDEETVEDSKPSSDMFSDVAEFFGLSSQTLACEFGAFKAQKLFKRINLLLVDPTISDEDLKVRIRAAVNLGFESVTVTPSKLKIARSVSNKKIRVRVALSYPFGGLSARTNLKMIGWSKREKADGVELYFMPSELLNKRTRQIIKEWRQYKKRAGKLTLFLGVDATCFDNTGLKSLAKIAKCAGVSGVKVFCDGNTATKNSVDIKHTLYDISNAFEDEVLEGAFYSDDVDLLMQAFKCGFDKASSKSGIELSVKIKRFLGCK
ncbi:MAG: hypothetical protein IJB13_00475 [Clostridia bacterium]|nr:hypothetical protein [Clostridia bacterium]